MPHSTRYQIAILQLILVMFKASPGADNLKILASQLRTNQSLTNLAQRLANSALFLDNNYRDLNSEVFAYRFVDNLFGDHVANANKMLICNFIVNQTAAGVPQDQLISEVTNALSAIPASDRNWGQAVIQHNINGINKILEYLLADTFTPNNRSIVKDHMIMQVASGKTLGETIIWAIDTVASVDLDNVVWGGAARLFRNRVEVSKYYSMDMAGTSIDFLTTQEILAAVSDDRETVLSAKAIIDSRLKNSATSFTPIDFQLYQTIRKISDSPLSTTHKNSIPTELMAG